MTRAAPLGDSHNFGRRVHIHRGRVQKPRTLAWEWLILGKDSPLRALLGDAFAFLPSLAFHRPHALEGGEVQAVALAPLPTLSHDRKRELAQIVGRSLALFAWLGVSDLHWENLVLGADRRGRIVFGPLDVETILDELSYPTETKLIPDADPEYVTLSRHAAGVRRVLPWLGKPVAPRAVVAIASAYRATLALLDRSARAIADVVARMPALAETPIRVLLRSTAEYVLAKDHAPWPPLLDAERTQLARGDVPYFFRLYGQRGIHYFTEPTLKSYATLPQRGDVPKLAPLLSLARGLRAPSRATLRDEGLFTVLGAFDHPGLSGEYEDDGLALRFTARTLVATWDGEELHARRNVSAYAASVYLPCRCGEVRTPFVPAVTRCTAT